jgi:hypothetical protein
MNKKSQTLYQSTSYKNGTLPQKTPSTTYLSYPILVPETETKTKTTAWDGGKKDLKRDDCALGKGTEWNIRKGMFI